MSHYTVGVIIPPYIIDKELYIEEALAPYDENKEVPSYWKDDNPTWEARWHLRTEHPHMIPESASPTEKRTIRKESTDVPDEDDPEVQALLSDPETMIDVLNETHEETWRYHDGQYQYRCTYNPKSKWDWYVVGGRWDGAIQGKAEELRTDNGFNFNSPRRIEDNIADIDELLSREEPFIPFALLTPDQWIGKGDMGWFGAWSKSDEVDAPKRPEKSAFEDDDAWQEALKAWREEVDAAWRKKALSIYRDHKDAALVVVDCHI